MQHRITRTLGYCTTVLRTTLRDFSGDAQLFNCPEFQFAKLVLREEESFLHYLTYLTYWEPELEIWASRYCPP